jgi:ABC-type sulfate transport system substrate-binding protein
MIVVIDLVERDDGDVVIVWQNDNIPAEEELPREHDYDSVPALQIVEIDRSTDQLIGPEPRDAFLIAFT